MKAENNPEQNFKCHCAEWRFKNAHFVVDEVREKVCDGLPFYGEIDGKQFCVLHYPSKDKAEDFDKVYQERIKRDYWDFRMVYFPSPIRIAFEERKEFRNDADFAHATFAEDISFKYCKFYGRFEFFDAIFLNDCSFIYSEFFGSIHFNNVDFQGYGDFSGVTFHEKSYSTFEKTKFKSGYFGEAKFHCDAKFSQSVFTDYIDFSNTDFFSKADFSRISLPQNKKADFRLAKFHKDADFSDTEFYETDFSKAKFAIDSNLNFTKTIFSNCKFNKETTFSDACFHNDVNFAKSEFNLVHFERAKFEGDSDFTDTLFLSDVFFNGSRFGLKENEYLKSASAYFNGAEFSDSSRVFFDNTWFSYRISFDEVKFNGYLLFQGSRDNTVFDDVFTGQDSWGLLSFVNMTIEKPDKIYFQSLRLRPNWFVKSIFDSRKVNLIDIHWGNKEKPFFTIEEELRDLEKRVKYNSRKLLIISYRQLAENAETNNRYEESSKFRRLAFELERLERKEQTKKWKKNIANIFRDETECRNFLSAASDRTKRLRFLLKSHPYDSVHFIYRWLSGYGENWLLAFCWLPAIWTFFATLYWLFGKFGIEGKDVLEFGKSLGYSLMVMTLQKPEPRPYDWVTYLFYGLETIFAPLQAALLALAIRRKFMR